ncbi:MAG: 50S ribosomal protein L10, partial [Actinomycetota bacterium]
MSTARAEKAAVVAEVRDKLAASNSVIVSEYRGLTVGALAKLRRTLRPLGAEYKVYKNSLVKIAARDGAMAPVEPMVGGPVAITFVTGEVSAVAKAMREFAKENEALKLKGAVVDGKAVDVKGLRALADLPSREVMLA